MKRFFRFILAMLVTVATLVATAVQCPEPEPPQPPPPDPPTPVKPIIDETYEITSNGAVLSIELTAAESWTASVEGGSKWCFMDNKSGEAGKATITITVAANESYKARTCTVRLKIGKASGKIVIKQAQLDVLTAEPGEFAFEAACGYVTTTVTANVPYDVIVSDDWLEWDNGIISVGENITSESRAATITLAGEELSFTINVSQAASDNPVSPFDGTVERLQTHTTGAGIPLVFMGDAFEKEKFEDGSYQALMQNAVEAFFTEEPYTTYRELFDIYVVNVVSDYYQDITTGTSTTLGTFISDGNFVGGDLDKCQQYASKAVGEQALDSTLAVVLLNTEVHAGRCYLSFADKVAEDADDGVCGFAVAFLALGTDPDDFAGLVHHEAGGHGFGKLADEYFYEGTGAISAYDVDLYKKVQANSHAYLNVDFTDDPEAVLWNHFLLDERYQADNLGIYQGGCSYESGVWHPSETSIMNLNTGGFNAPSREAIYYRLNKLAFGPEWVYDYEEFVAYDVVNRAVEPEPEPEPEPEEPAQAHKKRASRFKACPPPVIIFK